MSDKKESLSEFIRVAENFSGILHHSGKRTGLIQRDWKEEHPGSLDDIDPSFLEQLVDQSWRNDSNPIFTFQVTEKACFLLSVNYRNPQLRDHDADRFILSKGKLDSTGCLKEESDNILFQCEEFEDVVSKFKDLINDELDVLVLMKSVKNCLALYNCNEGKSDLSESVKIDLIRQLISFIDHDEKINCLELPDSVFQSSEKQVMDELKCKPDKFIELVSINPSEPKGGLIYVLRKSVGLS